MIDTHDKKKPPYLFPEQYRAMEEAIDFYSKKQIKRKGYESWRQIRLHQEEHQQTALETLRLLFGEKGKERSLLDVGCGLGGYVVALCRAGYKAEGIDFNPDYVAIAQQRANLYGLPTLFRQGMIESLPYASHAFGLVHCHDVLEHCQDPQQGLSELARVLQEDGHCLVTFINRLAWRDPHYRVWGVNWLPRKWGAWLTHTFAMYDISSSKDKQLLSEMTYYTYWGALKAVKKAGFRRIENVRRKKAEAFLLEKSRMLFGRAIPEWMARFASAGFAFFEYMGSGSFYWLLSK